MQVKLKRNNNAVHFTATNETGQSIELDGSPGIGGENLGVRPMENLLMSLGGCSGIDIQLILKKQRQTADSLEITITSERQKDMTPSLFEDIHVLFTVTGDLDESKLIKAVDLSMQKYCSVAKILEKSSTIHYTIELNGAPLSAKSQ